MHAHYGITAKKQVHPRTDMSLDRSHEELEYYKLRCLDLENHVMAL